MKHPDHIDTQLMAAVKTGCRTSFDRLYSRYRGKLRQFIWRKTGDWKQSEDLLHDVFLRVWIYRHTWQPRAGSTFEAWLYTITLKLIFRHWEDSRKKAFYIYIDDETDDKPPVQLPDYRWSPDRAILNEQLAAALNRQIQQLPKHYREPFVLREFYLLRYEEIAGILLLKYGTVKSRINRARTILQSKLSQFV